MKNSGQSKKALNIANTLTNVSTAYKTCMTQNVYHLYYVKVYHHLVCFMVLTKYTI